MGHQNLNINRGYVETRIDGTFNSNIKTVMYLHSSSTGRSNSILTIYRQYVERPVFKRFGLFE